MKKFTLFLFVLLSAFVSLNAQKYVPLDLKDIVDYTYWPNSVYGLKSLADGEHYSTIDDWKIKKYEYKTGKEVGTILDLRKLMIKGLAYEYELSNDESKVLLFANRNRIYRHSFTADFYIYDLTASKLSNVSDNGQQQVATISPDGKKVAFVRDNNLFIKDLITNSEVQITTDGEKNKIINGIPDWVYEEEFGFSQAYQWSPDGKYIAYIKFDESQVKEYTLTMYAGDAPHIKDNEVYPSLYTYKYPKAGEDNSKVSVWVYNLTTKETKKVNIGDENDIYIPRIRWNTDGSQLEIMKMNRLQNRLDLYAANPQDLNAKIILTETNKYYIGDEFYDNLIFTADGQYILLMSERDGWRQIYLYTSNGQFVRQLTKGNFDVTNFYGFDAKRKLVYFQAAMVSPLQREVYSVTLDGKKITKLSSQAGTNEAEFSSNYNYFINTFSNASTPTFVSLNENNGKQLRVLENNAGFKETIDKFGVSQKTFFTFKTSENVLLYAFRIVPPDFDSTKKYAAIVVQYSGPNSQTVIDDWEFGWENYLAQQGFVVYGVDTRGTGFRGEEFRKCTYDNLGKYETLDLIETAKYLGSLSYIDKNRLGIWGWSYGGFMVLNAMTKGNGIYSTGVAVAPVTSWRYYDNIYTERYNGLPQDNPSGYDDNSPLNNVDGFKGNLLLCFGIADDNVHPQNSYEFIEKMVQADKQFRMFSFTNRNHSIYGGNTRFYLYTMKTNFFIEKLTPNVH